MSLSIELLTHINWQPCSEILQKSDKTRVSNLMKSLHAKCAITDIINMYLYFY